jgi:hypothetical protein
LCLRKPEATSLTQSTCFNCENVTVFFENLKELISRHNFTANEIYNVDVTGNPTVFVPPKIICAKGLKQVGSVTSGDRDKCHNDCCCKGH